MKIKTAVFVFSIFILIGQGLDGTGKAFQLIGQGLSTAGQALESVSNGKIVKASAKAVQVPVKTAAKETVKLVK